MENSGSETSGTAASVTTANVQGHWCDADAGGVVPRCSGVLGGDCTPALLTQTSPAVPRPTCAAIGSAQPTASATATSNDTTRRTGVPVRRERNATRTSIECRSLSTKSCGPEAALIRYLISYLINCSDDQEPTVPQSPTQSRTAGRTRPAAPGRANAGRPTVDRSDVCEVQYVDRANVERARRAVPSPATLGALAEMLRALGDVTRLRIITALAAEGVGELCVCDLSVLVGVSESGVSHSLRTLRQLGIVRFRKVGKIAYYALDDPHVAQLVGEGVRHVEHER